MGCGKLRERRQMNCGREWAEHHVPLPVTAVVAIAVIVSRSQKKKCPWPKRGRGKERESCDTLAGVVTRSWWTVDGDKKKNKKKT